MKKTITFVVVAALSAVASVYAQSKIASVDMETVVVSHPKAAENTEALKKLKDDYEKELDTIHYVAKGIASDIEKLIKDAQDESRSELVRRGKIDEARQKEGKLRDKEAELREKTSDLQYQLRKREHELFMDAMVGITNAVTQIAVENKYDYVIDSSAARATAPIPIIIFANPSDDITDKVIAKIGGTKVDKRALRTEEETDAAE